MIEFFLSRYLKNQNQHQENYNNGNAESIVRDILWLLFVLFLSIMAAKLAFHCNLKSPKGVRMFITVIAFLWAVPYLLYYAIVYKLLGGKCN
jgi:hypothetical protein